ncbi:TBCC domain-containing protein 1-like [Iris pallida]|uniref:TBCC domain-containing protein 1 n=1 Tax=Iris pallida TaxID=29817 RepID=A0AAX6ID68_IRIPA|nr:TBCC domain-containing protein 1-like [Iris pallida]KAJ6850734.1 TBCC domain-containing protein 1-like [Iris pallida]
MNEEEENPKPNLLLLPRRELFEHGLLPIPKLVFSDGTLTLAPLRDQLLLRRSPESGLVSAETLSESLQISHDHAELVVEALASVLPLDREVSEREADVFDLVLFLYLQSYKRLVPRGHKDSAAVADVWPSTSAFDGCLSALSPLQLVRSNSRRFMPSQADEEAHQLSYLQKHMPNILALLAESVEGEGEEALVLTLERFQHLGFFIQFVQNESEGVLLSQAVPFFANSDPDMPAVPVPAVQVLDWISQSIAASLERVLEKTPSKEKGSINAAYLDMTAANASLNTWSHGCSSPSNAAMPTYSRCQAFVEGISKSYVVKRPCDIKGRSLKVLNCQESVIYILAPLSYATVYGCSDATVVLGAVGKAVRVEHCERVQVITAARRICIANCREGVFFLGVNQRPLILGDNHKLKVAPYNTFYPLLEEHMSQVGINASVNKWDAALVLGMVDPHDSLSHPAGVSDVQAESATCLHPDQFTTFLIPKWFAVESTQPTIDNPFPLPETYMASIKRNHSISSDIQQVIRNAQLEDNQKRDLSCGLHAHFKDWLYASGNIRQLHCLQGD